MRPGLYPPQTVGDHIYNIILSLIPFDTLEAIHIQETLKWMKSGVSIFRLAKPNCPPKHLVSYFVLLDEKALKILLVDHKKAQLWLPSGGHVEIDEHPQETVQRECYEELGIKANFCFEDPIFLTSTLTVGLTAGHTDVSLWYVLEGDSRQPLVFDKEEFNDIQWFELANIPYDRSDPHLRRFVNKLQTML
jgi:8-oxo-dGTP pyrophosphatase MutT (NUDIX family)